MDTRRGSAGRIDASGRINPALAIALTVVAVLAVAAWFLVIRPDRTFTVAPADNAPALPAHGATSLQPTPSTGSDTADVDQLLAAAGEAVQQQHYLAPVRSNAFELYLRVLQLQPGNQAATDALRETFSFAADSAEHAINSDQFDDAQRQIDLLAKADPANFTVTILRSKLSARLTLLEQQQRMAGQQKAQQAAAQQVAAEPKPAGGQPVVPRPAPQPVRQQPVSPSPVMPRPPAASAAPMAAGVRATNTDAVLTQAAAPTYPPEALRAGRNGWVVVSFTVDGDGHTSDVQVIRSQPRRIFDRAAIEAVRRYRFTPATRDGVAVSSTRQQRIEFTQ